MTKGSRQKFKYLENEKSFSGEIEKYFSLVLKRFQLSKNNLGPGSAPLKMHCFVPYATDIQFTTKREDLKLIR